MRRRRAIAAALVGAAALGAWLLLLRGPAPPADRAAALVPAEALAYLHLSTDPDRDEDRRLDAVLRRFPSYLRLRQRLERLVSARAGGFDLERDVRPWLGDEVGLALLDSGERAANVLILLAVRDEPKAQGLLLRAAGAAGGVEHRGIAVRRFGGVAAAFVGGFLVLGQEPAVKAAIDRHRGRGRALGAATALPDARSLDLRLSPDGVRRVLRAQAGALAAAGALLDHPALRGVSVAVAAEDEGLRVHVRQRRSRGGGRGFEPELLDAVPDDAAGYLGLGDLRAARALLGATGVAGLLGSLQQRIPELDIDRDLLGPLRGEVALSVVPALPVPIVTLVARTDDEARTREAVGKLGGAIADLLAPADDDAAGQVPTFQERRLRGVTAYSLTLGPDSELLYAVTGGRLIVSTAPAGIQRVVDGGDSLRDDERFRRAVGEVPDRAEALVFLDLAQLLTLGDQAGIAPGTAFQAARDDLRRVRAVAAVAKREDTDTTAELFLEIP